MAAATVAIIVSAIIAAAAGLVTAGAGVAKQGMQAAAQKDQAYHDKMGEYGALEDAGLNPQLAYGSGFTSWHKSMDAVNEVDALGGVSGDGLARIKQLMDQLKKADPKKYQEMLRYLASKGINLPASA